MHSKMAELLPNNAIKITSDGERQKLKYLKLILKISLK